MLLQLLRRNGGLHQRLCTGDHNAAASLLQCRKRTDPAVNIGRCHALHRCQHQFFRREHPRRLRFLHGIDIVTEPPCFRFLPGNHQNRSCCFTQRRQQMRLVHLGYSGK